MTLSRREWIAMLTAAPLLKAAPETAAPAAPVSIARCASYDEDLVAQLGTMFDQLGGIEKLMRNKTVTVKVNMTGAPSQRYQGRAPALTHYTHPKLLGAAAHLFVRYRECGQADDAGVVDQLRDFRRATHVLGTVGRGKAEVAAESA